MVETLSVSESSSAGLQPPVVTTARVVTTETLDREDTALYRLTLNVQDSTASPLTASVPLTVTVLDVNDNSPLFSQSSFSFTVSEDTENLLLMDFTVSDCYSLCSCHHAWLYITQGH